MKISKKASTALLISGSAVATILLAVNIAAFGFLDKVFDAYFAEGGTVVNSNVSKEEVKKKSRDLCSTIEGEGIVLVENKEIKGKKALPLSDKGNINVLGYRSTNIYYGGTGSGSASTKENISFITALKNEGFKVNEDLIALYGGDKISQESGGVGNTDFNVTELPLSKYTGKTDFSTLKAFSETALIVIGRGGGEGNDLPTDMTKYGGDASHHYLELSKEENDLVKKASETFSNVIVVLNTANAMELGFLEDYDNVSSIWIGQPGSTGCKAVAEVLSGTINPSGRFVNTYVYDNFSAPASHDIVPEKYEYDKDIGYTIEYSEGIYVGYRYYETAAKEGKIVYDDVVQYPFGYGLSYTEFAQSIVGGTTSGTILNKDSKIELDVKVENKGGVDGKEVIQVYSEAPYNNGGLEKASKVLVAFDKVGVNQGEDKTVKLEINAEDLASYDSTANNGEGAYVLEKGIYHLSIQKNSHDVIQTIDLNVDNDIVYSAENKRQSDEVPAKNLFSEAAGDVTYLSRKDGFANYSEATKPVNKVPSEQTIEALTKGISKYSNEGVGNALPTEKEGKLTIQDLYGKSFDDPMWDDLISQMSVNEMTKLIGYAGYGTIKVASIGKGNNLDTDGPAGLSYYMNKGKYDTVSFCIEVVIASTWNKDLAKQFGERVGDEANINGFTGWYAPGCNTHRTPFGGRNYEYFSEDGLLAGKMAAGICGGALSKGVVTYAKHFALNDQETKRTDQVCTWSNEQAMRELYFKPFEFAVKEGGSLGMMTSYNFIGDQWTGGMKELCTDLVRNEWGFQGAIITDYGYGTYQYMNPDKAIRAGNNMMLSTLGTLPKDKSKEGLYFIQQSTKSILYAIATASNISNAKNVLNSTPLWRVLTYVADGVLGAASLAMIGFGVYGVVTRKKAKEN